MKNGQLFATIPTIIYLCSTNTVMRWLVIPHAKLQNPQKYRFRWDFVRKRTIWFPVGSGKNCNCPPQK